MVNHPDVIRPGQYLSYLEQARQGKHTESSKFGFPQIDDFLRFKAGNFVVVTGHANVGKTHTMLFLMLIHTLNNGTIWCIYSSENEVKSIQRKILEFLCVRPITHIDDKEFARHLDFINAHFIFIDGNKLYDVFSLISVMEEIRSEYEFQGALIDPYNSLTINQKKLGKISSHEYHYEATSHIRIFCKQYNVCTIVNTHPVTEALRKVHYKGHPFEGHPMPPMASDVEGGGKFVNRSDEFVVLHRYTQHSSDWIYSYIHVRKVKELETGGRPTPLEAPIKIESMKYNVGYFIDGAPIIKPKANELIITGDDNAPF
jgi:replicative DNA helicase